MKWQETRINLLGINNPLIVIKLIYNQIFKSTHELFHLIFIHHHLFLSNLHQTFNLIIHSILNLLVNIVIIIIVIIILIIFIKSIGSTSNYK